MSGSGIRWAICKSAPCSRQITMPVPHHSVLLTASADAGDDQRDERRDMGWKSDGRNINAKILLLHREIVGMSS